MLEMLKERKAALEAQGKKGFTLMEMLIVIAIIAVLIAIAIPIFTAQLEKSREATDLANVRSAYATLQAQLISDGTASQMTVHAEQQDATNPAANSGWEIGSHSIDTMVNGVESQIAVPAKTDTYTVSVDSTGNVSIG